MCNLYHPDPFVVASEKTAHEWAILLNKLCSLNLTHNPHSNVKWKKIEELFKWKNISVTKRGETLLYSWCYDIEKKSCTYKILYIAYLLKTIRKPNYCLLWLGYFVNKMLWCNRTFSPASSTQTGFNESLMGHNYPGSQQFY